MGSNERKGSLSTSSGAKFSACPNSFFLQDAEGPYEGAEITELIGEPTTPMLIVTSY